MTTQSQNHNLALSFAHQRTRNLDFFRKTYPAIYNFFKDYRMTRAEVVISAKEEEVDLWVDGKSLYNGEARARAKHGVELFVSTFAPGKKIPSLPPPWPGDYYHPRFAHMAVDSLTKLSPVTRETFNGYPIPNFYPLVVFQGVGLGYQIEKLIESYDVENAIVLEPDVEIFAASLLTTDWEKVYKSFQKSGQSLRFLIGAEHTEEGLWGALLENLLHFSPVFPIMNFFLNERGDPVMEQVARRLNREAVASLTVWGHYDDEVRQINNALHAFHKGIRTIPDRGSLDSDVPVLVVGSGPSLDQRIDDIKSVRDEVFIVSAGTGLRVLLENDIYPDFHVELESDYLNYRVISSYNREKLKKICIVAASQVCPLVWDLFGEQRLYFKKESPISGLFGTPEVTISHGTPTCTNAALALCSQMGLRNIYLFGTDFGFADNTKHHAEQSVYMKSEDEALHTELTEGATKAFSSNKTFSVKGVQGTRVHTTPTYFTAKRSVEYLISLEKAKNQRIDYFNCADGADIEGANWLDSGAFLEAVKSYGSRENRNRVFNTLFSRDAKPVGTGRIKSQLEATEKDLENLHSIISQLIKGKKLEGKKDITRVTSEVSRYMEQNLINQNPSFYYMIRGAVRHFLYVGFAHALAMDDSQDVAGFLKTWKSRFLDCLEALPKHFHKVTHKDYDMTTDPWIYQSINDPE
ncbi:6-hydroxymethylpterin diphosphokinase MptE-like protein [Marinobacter sp.]|uniref:motility associated factor glycosyltransferase family protein n=1 Tax=Marinobacter sp. TaxID=50741 RepID=UPI003A912E27